MNWFYLSFCEDKWLGACCVQAADAKDAVVQAHRQKCNPGGEVLIFPTDEPPAEARNRLLNKQEVEQFFGPVKKLITNSGDVVETEDG